MATAAAKTAPSGVTQTAGASTTAPAVTTTNGLALNTTTAGPNQPSTSNAPTPTPTNNAPVSYQAPRPSEFSPNSPNSGDVQTNAAIFVHDIEEDDDDVFDEQMQIDIPVGGPAGSPGSGKRQSIAIGGMKKVNVSGLPPNWSLLQLGGKDIYVNTETMQSSSIRPNDDGTIPASEDKGW